MHQAVPKISLLQANTLWGATPKILGITNQQSPNNYGVIGPLCPQCLGQRAIQFITFGAGAIAKAYSDMGGRVTWFGKPHTGIYEFALSKLSNIPRNRILCIGDSLEHDVRGAKNFGCPVALVRTGLSNNLIIESIVKGSVSADVPDYLIDNFVVK